MNKLLSFIAVCVVVVVVASLTYQSVTKETTEVLFDDGAVQILMSTRQFHCEMQRYDSRAWVGSRIFADTGNAPFAFTLAIVDPKLNIATRTSENFSQSVIYTVQDESISFVSSYGPSATLTTIFGAYERSTDPEKAFFAVETLQDAGSLRDAKSLHPAPLIAVQTSWGACAPWGAN